MCISVIEIKRLKNVFKIIEIILYKEQMAYSKYILYYTLLFYFR